MKYCVRHVPSEPFFSSKPRRRLSWKPAVACEAMLSLFRVDGVSGGSPALLCCRLPACYLAVRVELLPTDFGTGSDDRSVHNGSVRPVFERSSPITQRGLS